jgi:hypothetical protein
MCEYCEKKKSIVFNRFVESHLFISKEEKRIYWRLDNIPENGRTCVSYADIEFCPMCGRKLNKQPPAMAKENENG